MLPGNALQPLKPQLDVANGLPLGQSHLEHGAHQGLHADLEKVVSRGVVMMVHCAAVATGMRNASLGDADIVLEFVVV